MPLKKFNTRGEEFLHFLKSLGYKPIKHQKAEHFEYLFQDEDVFRLTKAMMKKIKPHNMMGTEEIQRFQVLTDENCIFYGKDLEDAVEREKAIEQKIALDRNIANIEEAKLIQLIEDKKKNIERLNSINMILDETIEAQNKEDAIKQLQIAKMEAESEHLDKEIRVERKMLWEKQDELQRTVEKYLTMCKRPLNDEKNPSLLVELDWEKIMDDEDRLMNMIKPMIEKYGADLIRKSNEDDGIGVLETESIHKIFEQHAKDFERLRHSIIYEKIQAAEHQMKLSGEIAGLDKLFDCSMQVDRIAKITNRAVLAKLQIEIRESNANLEGILVNEKAKAINHVKSLVIQELDNDIKEIIDLKAQTKKKVQEFFDFIVDILSLQKIRVDLLRELLRTEGRDGEKLARHLMEQKERQYNVQRRQEIVTEGITADKVSPESMPLFKMVQKFDIPVCVLESHKNTMIGLSAIRTQVSRCKFEKLKLEDTELKIQTQRLVHKQEIIRDLFDKVKAKNIDTEEERLIKELEKIHVEMQEKLDRHNQNKAQIVQDNINKKWALMKRIQMTLSKSD